MQRNFFSIIIPARQLNHYLLNETLPSIENQSYKKFEVIILPNFDHGFEVLKKKYSWLKVIKNNSMPGIKRDFGVKKSKGDIVVFIDDDAYPPKDWLKILNTIYQKKSDVVAVGGPGILPEKINIWEKIFNEVLLSFMGTGGFSYRFVKGEKKIVDDFPSMNLSLRKNIFVKLGGFKNKYWPGEDSKLINALINKEKKLIYYDPKIYIYHHRRDNLLGYLKQHRNYGMMRGMFLAHGDKNSQSMTYKIPTLFVFYIFILSILYAVSTWRIITVPFLKILTVPIWIYAAMICLIGIITLFKISDILISIGTMVVLILTHIIYGVSFIKGFIKGTMNK